MTIGRDIQKKIVKVLRDSENPVSTRDLALKIGRAWHSVQHHCFRLQIAGKIHGFQVGRMNLPPGRHLINLDLMEGAGHKQIEVEIKAGSYHVLDVRNIGSRIVANAS